MAALKKDVENDPEAYLHERANRLKVSPSGIFYALKRLKITYKKKRYNIPSEMKKSDKISKKK